MRQRCCVTRPFRSSETAAPRPYAPPPRHLAAVAGEVSGSAIPPRRDVARIIDEFTPRLVDVIDNLLNPGRRAQRRCHSRPGERRSSTCAGCRRCSVPPTGSSRARADRRRAGTKGAAIHVYVRPARSWRTAVRGVGPRIELLGDRRGLRGPSRSRSARRFRGGAFVSSTRSCVSSAEDSTRCCLRFGAWVEVDELRRIVDLRREAIARALDLVKGRVQMTSPDCRRIRRAGGPAARTSGLHRHRVLANAPGRRTWPRACRHRGWDRCGDSRSGRIGQNGRSGEARRGDLSPHRPRERRALPVRDRQSDGRHARLRDPRQRSLAAVRVRPGVVVVTRPKRAPAARPRRRPAKAKPPAPAARRPGPAV